MANGLRIIPEALRNFDSEEFDGTFQPIGIPLVYACCLLKFINNSNVDIFISWDGVTSHDFIAANGFALYDVCSDAGSQRGLYAAQGTQFWVMGDDDITNVGLVYLVAFHTSEF